LRDDAANATARAAEPAPARMRSSARCRERCSPSRSRRETRFQAGQVVCIVEAMKMENEVHAHRAGRVTELSVAPGEPVKTGQVICVVSAD
jgi:pyruvate carboxylase